MYGCIPDDAIIKKQICGSLLYIHYGWVGEHSFTWDMMDTWTRRLRVRLIRSFSFLNTFSHLKNSQWSIYPKITFHLSFPTKFISPLLAIRQYLLLSFFLYFCLFSLQHLFYSFNINFLFTFPFFLLFLSQFLFFLFLFSYFTQK
jgi:hypothetical protein